MDSSIPNPDAEKKNALKGLRNPTIAVAVLVIGFSVAFFYRWWLAGTQVSTDNAFVEGEIIPISAKVSGFVKKAYVDENTIVHKGDLLLELDDRDFSTKLAQAEAEYKSLQWNVGSSDHLGGSDAQVKLAIANAQAAAELKKQNSLKYQLAQRNLERARSLAERGMVTKAFIDAAESEVATTLAEIRKNEFSTKAAETQVSIDTANRGSILEKLNAAETQVTLARNQLQDVKVLAPSAGIIAKKSVGTGQYVQVGQALFKLVLNNDLWITANLKETDIANILPRARATAVIDSYPNRSFNLVVESIGGATGSRFSVLPTDNATGNYTKIVQRIPVKLRFTDPLPADLPLRPGMSANVTIQKN